MSEAKISQPEVSPSPKQVTPKIVIQQDPCASLKDAMRERGLEPEELIQDGKIHRFDVDKKGDKVGWYVFFGGDIAGAAFGNWKTDYKGTWCQCDPHEMPHRKRFEYNLQIKKAFSQKEEEEQKKHAIAQKEAQRIWEDSVPALTHQYLESKGIEAHGIRVTKKGDLVVPSFDEKGCMWSLQYIDKNGAKKFQARGKRSGLFFEIRGHVNHVYLCEGFATGATINEVTGATVLCAFTAGNLPKVAMIIREKYPDAKVKVCADNDQFNQQGNNVGIKKAEEAATLITNATVVSPTFKNIDTKPTDFNDLFKLEGRDAVLSQLSINTEETSFPPLNDRFTKIKDRVVHRPPPKEFVWNCFGEGFLPKGVVGVLAATGGTGKTFMLCSLALMSANGKDFGPISATKPMKTLMICSEDDQEEIDRRCWDIAQGDFPELLYTASVYGQVGPLMELDRNKPRRAKGFYWLEKTIQGHKGLELLILDPKSRFYGLDENNNDHATQWIRCLEYLSKKYNLTIIFSAHTSEQNSGRISQKMNRGASALVDGCRWQAGLIRMGKKEAEGCGLDDDPRLYIIMDTPKNNYAKDVANPLVFKRTDSGALEYCSDIRLGVGNKKVPTTKTDAAILTLLGQEEWQGTKYSELKTSSFCEQVRALSGGTFNVKDIPRAFERLKKDGRIEEVEIQQKGRGPRQKIIRLTKVAP